MDLNPRHRLAGLGRLVAIAVGACAGGAGLGLALGGLTEDADRLALSTTQRTPNTVATSRPAPASTVPAEQDAAPAQRLRPSIRVRSAVLTPAGSDSGEARQRARLSVRLRITNRTGNPVPLEDPVLLVGDEEVRADPNAAQAPALRRPLPPNGRVTREMRFETAGEITQRLVQSTQGRLRYSGRTTNLRIEIGEPASPGG